MADYDNTNRGVLFKNERKEKETHPDYTGSINVDGTDKSVAAWVKTSKAGKKYLSLSVSDPREPEDRSNNDTNDKPLDLSEIPF